VSELPQPAAITRSSGRLLTAAAFRRLADVPAEVEWFANLGKKATRRAYETALKDFMRFTGIARPEEFRIVTRAHVIAWRDFSRYALGVADLRNAQIIGGAD
jgi:hypothetical protein